MGTEKQVDGGELTTEMRELLHTHVERCTPSIVFGETAPGMTSLSRLEKDNRIITAKSGVGMSFMNKAIITRQMSRR